MRQLSTVGGWRFYAFKGKVSCATTILFVRIPNTSIVRMIKNKGYAGYLINGAVETECPQLRIIEPELFEQAQELRQARTCERGGTSLGTSSKALLTGLVYCGH